MNPMPEIPEDDEMLTPEETGADLGGPRKPISPGTLAYWRAKGQGPRFVKFGRHVRYPRSWLRLYKQQMAVPAPAE
jgi:hypothetical protein